MTGYGQPTLRIPDRPDTGWMTKAACTPHPAWTSEIKPKPAVMIALRAICGRCPVIQDCAAYALDENVHSGVYAGTWLPSRSGPGWLDARHHLHQKTRTIPKGTP